MITNAQRYVILDSMVKKLIYHPDLYTGDSINVKKLDKLKKRLEQKPLLTDVFLITIAQNPQDQLEIFSARQLAQNYYQKYPVTVVAIAGSYEEAVGLLEQLVRKCMEQRGDCNLKELFLC